MLALGHTFAVGSRPNLPPPTWTGQSSALSATFRVMRSLMLSVSVVALLCLAACASVGANVVDVKVRVAAQNALFEEWYQSDLRAHPEQATAYGDYRYNDQLDRHSLAALSAEHASDQEFLAHLRAIPTTGCSEQDELSHEVLVRALQQRIDNYDLKEYEMPVSQMK